MLLDLRNTKRFAELSQLAKPLQLEGSLAEVKKTLKTLKVQFSKFLNFLGSLLSEGQMRTGKQGCLSAKHIAANIVASFMQKT